MSWGGERLTTKKCVLGGTDSRLPNLLAARVQCGAELKPVGVLGDVPGEVLRRHQGLPQTLRAALRVAPLCPGSGKESPSYLPTSSQGRTRRMTLMTHRSRATPTCLMLTKRSLTSTWPCHRLRTTGSGEWRECSCVVIACTCWYSLLTGSAGAHSHIYYGPGPH